MWGLRCGARFLCGEVWFLHSSSRPPIFYIHLYRMYREADLKDLFRSYRRLAPLRDTAAVERVVEDLGVELDVRGGGGGRGRH